MEKVIDKRKGDWVQVLNYCSPITNHQSPITKRCTMSELESVIIITNTDLKTKPEDHYNLRAFTNFTPSN
jgi:hypothetical protein